MTSRTKYRDGKLPSGKANARAGERKVSVTDAEIEEALMNTAGIYGTAAQWLLKHKDIKISREGVRKRVVATEHLLEAKCNAENVVGDVAEKNIVGAIYQGDVKASQWYLERRCKDRGYSAKFETEVSTPEGKSVKIVNEFEGVPATELAKMTRGAFDD